MNTPDPLFASLDPLVRDGTLNGEQARLVYRQLSGSAATATAMLPVAADELPAPADRRGLLTAAAIIGAGVVTSGLLLSASLAESNGFHWKTFLPMLVITLGFAGAAVLTRWPLDRRRGLADLLTAVLLTLAVLSLGVTMLAPQATGFVVYLAAIVLLLGGIGGFWLLQRDVITVAAIAGGALLLGRILSDTVNFSEDDTSGPVLLIGVLFLLYGILVVAAGWRFSCRNLTGIVGSIIAVASMHMVAVVLLFVGFLTAVTSQGRGAGSPYSDARGDLKVALVLGLLAAAAVAGLFAYTRRPGYAFVSFIGAALLPLLVATGLAASHPLRWSLGYAIAGGLVVGAAALERLMSSRQPPVTNANDDPSTQRIPVG
jgi:hypothetical protein